MNAPVRVIAFFCGAAGLAVVLLAAFSGLHPVGRFNGAYGRLLEACAVAERHSPDVVSAINFDYRGFDTVGEELILFSSVAGVALLLRSSRKQTVERDPDDVLEHAPDRDAVHCSDSVRLLALAVIGVDVLFGIDIVVHGQLSPGGGFQGGVILASAPLLAYLGGSAEALQKIAPRWLVEIGEAFGAAAFVIVGAIGLAAGGAYMENVLPLGPSAPAGVTSGGTIALGSLATGIEVGAGFVLLTVTFLEESLGRRRAGGKDPA